MLAVDGEAARLRRSTAAAEGTITAGGPHAARQGRVAVSRAGATTSKEDEYRDIDHKKPTFFSAGGWWTWTRSPARQRLIIPIFWNHKPEDIRVPFEQFGPVKDVYLPRNFHTRELRGFGFVKFQYPEDAAAAKQEMNHQVIGGREISISYAEENRKTPQEMRMRTRISGRYMDGRYTRRALSRSPRSRSHSYSPSPSPVRHHIRGRNHHDNYSRRESYSPCPRDNKHYRSDSQSPSQDGGKPHVSPVTNGHGPPVVSSPR